MMTYGTFLAPGQRYVRPNLAPWRADQQITIVHVARDANQVVKVTYRCPSGREVCGDAAKFEVAVALGDVIPVTGAGLVGRC